ncbi:MAG: hypothetical protein OHK0024_35970 [Thalassobaculales bacterium]
MTLSDRLQTTSSRFILTRAAGDWCTSDCPAGTPILILPPIAMTDEQIDDGDAFQAGCLVLPFRRRSEWRGVSSLARLVGRAVMSECPP